MTVVIKKITQGNVVKDWMFTMLKDRNSGNRLKQASI